MSENSILIQGATLEPKTARSLEEVFQALPPLGSDAYIEHVSKAATRELPSEVLARALRNNRLA